MTFIFFNVFSLLDCKDHYNCPHKVAIHKCLLVTITHVLLNKVEFRVNKIIFLVSRTSGFDTQEENLQFDNSVDGEKSHLPRFKR